MCLCGASSSAKITTIVQVPVVVSAVVVMAPCTNVCLSGLGSSWPHGKRSVSFLICSSAFSFLYNRSGEVLSLSHPDWKPEVSLCFFVHVCPGYWISCSYNIFSLLMALKTWSKRINWPCNFLSISGLLLYRCVCSPSYPCLIYISSTVSSKSSMYMSSSYFPVFREEAPWPGKLIKKSIYWSSKF